MEDFELVAVPEKYYGMFFGGDSYVILYTYHFHGREAHIIYFWQVSHPEPTQFDKKFMSNDKFPLLLSRNWQ